MGASKWEEASGRKEMAESKWEEERDGEKQVGGKRWEGTSGERVVMKMLMGLGRMGG